MPQSLWRTDGPGDADHGDKRTSHLPQTKTVTEWRWLLSGVLFPTNNQTTDTCNRCQTLFQTDTRWHRQCLLDNDKATDKKHKESSVIWVVQHRPDTTRTAVVGRVIPCASSRINHTLVVCITWGPRTKCYHCDSKGTYHSPDNHWDKRQGKRQMTDGESWSPTDKLDSKPRWWWHLATQGTRPDRRWATFLTDTMTQNLTDKDVRTVTTDVGQWQQVHVGMTHGTEPSTDTYPDMVKHMLVTGKWEQVSVLTVIPFFITRQLELPRHALTSGKKHTQKWQDKIRQETICNRGHKSFPALLGTLFDPCRLAYLAYTSNDWASPP